ncbi:hypothetical protein E4U41_005216 [Claviceps citrina]|nr:hypothetical protein E4U41_005216 [Claviceps citrina]
MKTGRIINGVNGLAVLAMHSVPASGLLRESSACGPGVGSCDESCCSEYGYCGTSVDYCGGSQCQLDYSHTCDTLVPPRGRDTSDVPRPRIGDVPYGPMMTSCARPGLVALTFDDGPFIYTADLLDQLDQLDVKATFFITGNSYTRGIDDASTAWPALLRRMHAARHQIGSHTWTHRDLSLANDTVRHAEVTHNEMALRNVFGWFPAYLRPPFLECDDGPAGCQAYLARAGYHVVSANLDSKDYMYDDPALIQQSKDRLSAGLSADAAANSYIVLMHDVHAQTVYNMTRFAVDLVRRRGYRLVTVGECLGDPEGNWYRAAA